MAAGRVSRGGLQADGERFFWTESRPAEEGRQVVVASGESGHGPVDVSPPSVSVRSRVHEYGGGAATVSDGIVYFVDQADQRWYRVPVEGDGLPLVLSPPQAGPAMPVRRGDGRIVRGGRWLVSVEEEAEGTTTVHRVVGVDATGSGREVRLVDAGGFVASPRPSPDGRWLAWVAWSHPSMPWDASEVRIAELVGDDDHSSLGIGRRVSGGPSCAVGQPRWLADGSLLFVDDRTGWWLPYRLPAAVLDRTNSASGPLEDRTRALVDEEAEFHGPDWALGQSTLAELPDGSVIARVGRHGRDVLVQLTPEGPSGSEDTVRWTMGTVEQPCVSIAGVSATRRGRVAVIGSTPYEAQVVVEVWPDGRRPPARLSAGPPHLDAEPARDRVSLARPHVVPTPWGTVPGLFFPPADPGSALPQQAVPPLVVFCHGGPTGAAQPGFDPVVQFFTSRGLAVAVPDYRGSTGYGRAYRESLRGGWGEMDVDDCVAFAAGVVEAGWADGGRMAIRGTSAGGLTALGALIRSRRFKGAVTWYGVTDLESLVEDTHDFESHYTDGLVGPWPASRARYTSRSPLRHPEQVVGSVLLLQGADDPVVPPGQAVRFAEQLARHGRPCRLELFPGESHGFKQASTIEAALTAELAFYWEIFADEPDGGGVPGVEHPWTDATTDAGGEPVDGR